MRPRRPGGAGRDAPAGHAARNPRRVYQWARTRRPRTPGTPPLVVKLRPKVLDRQQPYKGREEHKEGATKCVRGKEEIELSDMPRDEKGDEAERIFE